MGSACVLALQFLVFFGNFLGSCCVLREIGLSTLPEVRKPAAKRRVVSHKPSVSKTGSDFSVLVVSGSRWDKGRPSAARSGGVKLKVII